MKNRYIHQIPPEEWQQGKAFMLSEVENIYYLHPVQLLIRRAIADFEAGKFSYDGATFVKERTKCKFDATSFIHDWRNAMGFISYKVDRESLAEKRHQVIMLLTYKGLTSEEIEPFKNAYDYFKNNPKKFDGATIVKDLHDIKGLDLKAMLHDYECIMGANSSFKLWYKSAYDYYLNHFKLGNGNQILRFLGLCVLGIFFVPYCAIFTPKYYPIKKQL